MPLLISGLAGGTGGGLFTLARGEAVALDRLSTTALTMHAGELHRVLWSGGTAGPGAAELLTYDPVGVRTYRRLDHLVDAHDLAFHNGRAVVASSAQNAVVDLHGNDVWRGPGRGDACHVNCLLSHEGRLLVSAFGRFETHRGWAGRIDGAGIVFDAATDENVLEGLSAPHQVRPVDGLWAICNSGEKELIGVDPERGSVVRRVPLGNWTRGLAITADAIYVGLSARRDIAGTADRAGVAVLDRRTWEPIAHVPLPCAEVYDIVEVNHDLLDGVRNGFRTNGLRAGEQDRYALFRAVGSEPEHLWASGEPLPADACRVSLDAVAPPRARAGDAITVPLTITNRGSAPLASLPPHPVLAAARWFDAETGAGIADDGPRTRLPHAIMPGDTVQLDIELIIPPVRGRLDMRLTLVQQDVAWFDALDPGNGIRRLVEAH